jgi:pantoate--beta-alanine ligase
MSAPIIARSVAELRAQVAAWRRAGDTIAMAPTMGALHAGHVSLTQLARTRATRCVVSIFVNPTQFAPNEDFSKYPRTFAADLEKLAGAGVDLVFAPPPDEMYPRGFCTSVTLEGPAAAGLDDRFRPTHFAGVATVVAKLLIQCAPDVAIFGEKDFQQLAVISRMARDLDLPVEIVGAPTVREADGLALSSRNVYLSAQERAVAPLLYATLRACAARVAENDAVDALLGEGRKALVAAGFSLDYLELRDAETLGAPDLARPLRLLVAARLGATRLIDNIAASPGGS